LAGVGLSVVGAISLIAGRAGKSMSFKAVEGSRFREIPAGLVSSR
jgi:hypothetical protein